MERLWDGMTTAEIGEIGEQMAIRWLRERGFLIHHTNWRDGNDELDIVARKMGVLHFIEVKTRKAGGMTTPEDAMTPRKIKATVRAARNYLRQYKIVYDVQFDLIAVDRMEWSEWQVRYIENAIEFRW